MAFPAFLSIVSACEGAPTRPAYHMRASLLFCFAVIMSDVMNSCVGVKHIPGASGESREVSGPSPGYPHVWSKQGGQCLSGCVLVQTHATIQRNVMQNLRNLPMLGLSHMHVATTPKVPCFRDSSWLVLTTLGPVKIGPPAPRCASSSTVVSSVYSPSQPCVPLTPSLRPAARLDHAPPRDLPTPRLRPLPHPTNSASQAAPAS